MPVRRPVPLCALTSAAMVMALGAPALAHESGAHHTRAPLTAAPAETGEGEAMEAVANLQYGLLPGGSAAQSGSDIEFMRLGDKEYALAGTLRNGMQIVDITDPTAPTLAGVYACPITQGDIQVFRQGPRVLATYTADAAIAPTDNSGTRTEVNQARFESQCVSEVIEQQPADAAEPFDGNQLGTFIVDVTDPTRPTTVSFIEVPEGSHNQTVHPSGDYLYNSNSDLLGIGGLPEITIHEIVLPERPVKIQDFTFPPLGLSLGEESHDIFFNGNGTRAYVAALGSTLVLDTSDPEAPLIVSQFYDPAINVVHQADLVSLPRQDGGVRDLLIVTDEQAGAAASAACPGGGLHVYDVTGDKERNPLANKVGAWFIDSMEATGGATCTSHVLRAYPDQGLLTIAWYSAGVRTLDISGLAEVAGNPAAVAFGEGVGIREVGHHTFPDSDTWSFKTNRIAPDGSFFGYGNDLVRGLDVYRFDGVASGLGRTVPALEPADLTAPGCAAAPLATAYTDLDQVRETHRRSVDCVIWRAIAVGSVREARRVYVPAVDVTRGQMASFVVNALRAARYDEELWEPSDDTEKFDDTADSPHRDNISILAAMGIVQGVAEGRYDPEGLVTREQMATFMSGAAQFAVASFDNSNPDGEGTFSDTQNSIHGRTIQVGVNNGLFSGVTATTFAPRLPVRRDQMATFLVNLVNRIDAEPRKSRFGLG